jgi:addiction module HigA family antidote
MSKSEALLPPVHPGEILREDFMKPLGLTMNKLALELHVPATRIGEIVHERRRITRRLLSDWRVTLRPMLSFG